MTWLFLAASLWLMLSISWCHPGCWRGMWHKWKKGGERL